MAIKRLTIEMDDSPDTARLTGVPEGLRVTQPTELKERELTGIPTGKESDETVSPVSGKAAPRAPGRTVPDLVAEFVNDARAMVTILMFVPFVVFVVKIQSINDFVYPVVMGVLLNVVWFVVPWIQRLFVGKSVKFII